MEKYTELANYFLTEYEEYHVAAYFYHKRITLAEKVGNKVEMALGNLGFARCNDLFDKSDDAIQYLEKAMKLAKNHPPTTQLISKELIDIYKKMAQKYENEVSNTDKMEQDKDKALEYYQKCLDMCSQADDIATEGQIAYKIGQIYFKRDILDKAIEHQNKYMEITKKLEQSDVGDWVDHSLVSPNAARWRLSRLWRSAT